MSLMKTVASIPISLMKTVPSIPISNTNFEIYINILFLVFETMNILYAPFGTQKFTYKRFLHYKKHKTNIHVNFTRL